MILKISTSISIGKEKKICIFFIQLSDLTAQIQERTLTRLCRDRDIRKQYGFIYINNQVLWSFLKQRLRHIRSALRFKHLFTRLGRHSCWRLCSLGWKQEIVFWGRRTCDSSSGTTLWSWCIDNRSRDRDYDFCRWWNTLFQCCWCRRVQRTKRDRLYQGV